MQSSCFKKLAACLLQSNGEFVSSNLLLYFSSIPVCTWDTVSCATSYLYFTKEAVCSDRTLVFDSSTDGLWEGKGCLNNAAATC
jgi:hypothetical protein